MNDGIPFSITKSLYFRNFVHHLEPRVVVNHPTTYSRRLQKKQNYVKRTIKAEMKDEAVLGVGFTADGWESRAGDDYLGITGHFVNKDFQLRHLTVSCCPFDEAHTGDNIKVLL